VPSATLNGSGVGHRCTQSKIVCQLACSVALKADVCPFAASRSSTGGSRWKSRIIHAVLSAACPKPGSAQVTCNNCRQPINAIPEVVHPDTPIVVQIGDEVHQDVSPADVPRVVRAENGEV
jgi:hypothetical protein